MIGMVFFSSMRRLKIPLWPAALLSAAFLTGYGIMTGMSVSTRRAVIMFLFLLAGRLAGRTSDTLTSLTAAAAAILIPSPESLFDAGFQLSFGAVASAVILAPVLSEEGGGFSGLWKGRKAFIRKIRKSFLSSFAIMLGTLPMLLWHFYKWNPWSILANLLVIPLMNILLPLLLFLALLGLPATRYLRVAAGARPESSVFPGAPDFLSLPADLFVRGVVAGKQLAHRGAKGLANRPVFIGAGPAHMERKGCAAVPPIWAGGAFDRDFSDPAAGFADCHNAGCGTGAEHLRGDGTS